MIITNSLRLIPVAALLLQFASASHDPMADWQTVPLENDPRGCYYWNTKTQAVSWDHPSTFAAPAPAVPSIQARLSGLSVVAPGSRSPVHGGSPVHVEEHKSEDPQPAEPEDGTVLPRPTTKQQLLEHWMQHDQGWLTESAWNPEGVVWCMRKKAEHTYSKKDGRNLPMQDCFRFYSNNNQRILENAYQRRQRHATFDVNSSSGDQPRGMIVNNFGAFGNVASQSGRGNIHKGKYDMYRLQWNNPGSFNHILPEGQRSADYVLDRKLDCAETMRYGEIVFTVLEAQAIDKLTQDSSLRVLPSMTLAEWQAADAIYEGMMPTSRRVIPYEAQPVQVASPHAVATKYCPICMEDHPEAAFIEIGCGHSHCLAGMRGFINAQLDTMNCARITCPHMDASTKCKHHVTNEEAQAILTNGDYATYLVKLERFQALMGAAVVNSGDAEFEKYLRENTKPCPGCKKPIEKNQGCNHMTCSLCRCEFCWTCGGPYVAPKTPYSGPFQACGCDSSTCKYSGPAREGYCGARAYVAPTYQRSYRQLVSCMIP